MNQTPTVEGWAIRINSKSEYLEIYPNREIREGSSNPSQFADHTYVVFLHPEKRWGCFGRDKGGRQLLADKGNFNGAETAAHPNGQAGIIYGITGVCHQAANRILRGAGSSKTVKDAKGYWASYFLYGTYGIGSRFGLEFETLINRDELANLSGYAKAMALNSFKIEFAINNKLQYNIEEVKIQQLAEILTTYKYETQYYLEAAEANYNEIINKLLESFGAVLSNKEYEDLFDFPKNQYIVF